MDALVDRKRAILKGHITLLDSDGRIILVDVSLQVPARAIKIRRANAAAIEPWEHHRPLWASTAMESYLELIIAIRGDRGRESILINKAVGPFIYSNILKPRV